MKIFFDCLLDAEGLFVECWRGGAEPMVLDINRRRGSGGGGAKGIDDAGQQRCCVPPGGEEEV